MLDRLRNITMTPEIPRSPIQENFADTEIIPGLATPETRELPRVEDEVPRKAPRGKHRGSKRPRGTQDTQDRRTSLSAPSWGRPEAEAGDLRETFTTKNWVRFFVVVLPVALAVAFTTNQLFGPKTGPLSEFRLPLPGVQETPSDPVYSPKIPAPKVNPVTRKARPVPVKTSRTAVPSPTHIVRPTKSPEPSPSHSKTPDSPPPDTHSPEPPATPTAVPTNKTTASETPEEPSPSASP